MRAELARSLGAKGRLVSFRRISFPRVTAYTRAFRALIDVEEPVGLAEFRLARVLVGRIRA